MKSKAVLLSLTLNIDAVSSSTACSFRAPQSIPWFGPGKSVVVIVISISTAVIITSSTTISVGRVTPAHGEVRLRGSAGALSTYFAVLPTLAAAAAAIPLRHRPWLRIDATIVLNGAEAEAAPFVDAGAAMRTGGEPGLALTVVTSLLEVKWDFWKIFSPLSSQRSSRNRTDKWY